MDRFLLFCLLTQRDLFLKYVPILDGVVLQHGDWEVVNWVRDVFKKNGKLPTPLELAAKFEIFQPYLSEGYNLEIVDRMIREYIQTDRVKAWLLRVAGDVERGRVDYLKVFGELRNLVKRYDVQDTTYLDVSKVYGEVIDKMISPTLNTRLPLGLQTLDKVLFGGIGYGEVGIMIALPGRGKTTFLVNSAYSVYVDRKNVLFVSCELGADAILGRMYRRILKKNRKEIVMEKDLSLKFLKDFFRWSKSRLFVEYVKPRELSIIDLEHMLERIEDRENVKIDLVIVDYLDKMRLLGRELRIALRTLVEDLKDFCMTNNVAFLTATQANRTALEVNLVTEGHVSESFGKVEAADIILSLSRNNQEVKNGRGRITVLKNREFGGVGTMVPVKMDLDRMVMEEYDFE